MFEKDINEITEEDLKSLVDNEVQEDRRLEYKGELNLSDNEHKRKLLKTVCAFSNTSGGLLIYGITENGGFPDELVGLDFNPDTEISRVIDIIKNRSEPPIGLFEPHSVDLPKIGKKALLIKVFKSWRAPHRVRMNGKNEFFIRNKNKSDPMDIEDLRIGFNLSETFAEKIRSFREDRISKISSGETPVSLREGSKIVIHLVPLNAFYPGQNYDIEKITNDWLNLRPFNETPNIGRYNLDGFITYHYYSREDLLSYLQIYRNGIIETTDSEILSDDYIPSEYFEEKIIKSINSYLDILKNLRVETPILMFLTLIDVKGKYMYIDRMSRRQIEAPVIDRDILLLPEFIIEEYDEGISRILRSCIDTVWNACGYPKSPNFDDNNEWNPK